MAIIVQRGPAPKVRVRRREWFRGELEAVAQKMAELRPGEWFIVPGTAGKIFKHTTYVRCRLVKFAKSRSLAGVVIAHTDGDKGVLVKAAEDGDERSVGVKPVAMVKPAGPNLAGTNGQHTGASGRGKASRKC